MQEKRNVFNAITAMLEQLHFKISAVDDSRPWGGFFVIDEAQAREFAKHFFAEEKFDDLKITNKLSPKVLLVEPEKRLSWQYHFRRAEIWKCIAGPVRIITSDDDEEKEELVLKPGDIIKLKQGQRHRLVGMETWGVVSEIWQHTDETHPSDENDIVRLQDDYGR